MKKATRKLGPGYRATIEADGSLWVVGPGIGEGIHLPIEQAVKLARFTRSERLDLRTYPAPPLTVASLIEAPIVSRMVAHTDCQDRTRLALPPCGPDCPFGVGAGGAK